MVSLLSILLVLSPGDVTSGVLLEGTPHAIRWSAHDSGKPGPCVLVLGGCHGDEPAGAEAAAQIRHWPVTKGRLIVIPRVNPVALAAGKRRTPGLEKGLADLNRNYGDKPRGAQAKAVWSFVQKQKPDWVIDLHEGWHFHRQNAKSVGSTVIVSGAKSQAHGEALVAAVDRIALAKNRHFELLKKPVEGSLVRAAHDVLGIPGMILETTTRKQRLPYRALQHRLMVATLLRRLGMSDDAGLEYRLGSGSKQRTKVALYDSTGTGGKGVVRCLQILGAHEEMEVVRVGARDIRAGALKRFDCVIFSGGSGGKQGRNLGIPGRKKVEAFVRRGGGYLGICAGSYLATSGFSWSIPLLDAKTASSKWKRGKGKVVVELSPEGRRFFGGKARFEVLYANGPITVPGGRDDLPDFEVLGHFRTELAKNGTPKGIMKDSPAILRGRLDKGRILCFSPHPEQTQGLDAMITRAVRWIAGR